VKFTFELHDITLLAFHELDIRFDGSIFKSLFAGQAGPDFDLLLIQPNNPPGAFGDYSLLALVDNPSLASPLSVGALMNPAAKVKSLPYFINVLDPENGFRVLQTLASGSVTTGARISDTPEPGTLAAAAVALLWLGWKVTRSRVRT
jgi:hypothetical protein